MSPSTDVIVVATKSYDDAGRILYSVALDIESTWNNDIPNSMSVSTSNVTLDISDYNPSDANDAHDAAQEEIMKNYSYLVSNWDAVLVRDNRNYSSPSGVAPPGYPNKTNSSTAFAAGSNTQRCIAYCTDSFSSHLEAHEVGHMYGGDHDRHEHYGLWEHTVMGNSGDPTCSGGSATKTRTNEWSNCSVSDIEKYMNYWDNEEGVF